MAEYPKLKAVIHIQETADMHNILKRLALFFDEIYYILPPIYVLTEGNREIIDLDNFKNMTKNEKGGIILPVKSLYENAEPILELSADSLKSDLKETIFKFEENGIMRRVQNEFNFENDANFLEIRKFIAIADSNDILFNQISKTSLEDYKQSEARSITIKWDDPPQEENIITLEVPQAFRISHNITTSMFLSNEMSLFPVFSDPVLHNIMAYRYDQYKKGLEFLKERSSSLTSPEDFKGQFGEVTFLIANSLFASNLISQKSPEEIVKYRSLMEEARQKFLSQDLMEIANITQMNPWNSQTKNEIEKYIFQHLRQDIISYNEKSQEIWKKLFGTITTHLSDTYKSALAGSGAGGLLGQIIPNTSTWHMLLLGALAGAAMQAPDITKDIIEIISNSQKEKKSSIAYITEFNKKSK